MPRLNPFPALALAVFFAAAVQAAMANEALQFQPAGASLPTAPALDYDTRDESLCQGDARAPASNIEAGLVSRGWLLTGDALAQGDSTALIASAGLAGQCRPHDTRIFVYRGERYLGEVRSADPQAWPKVSLASDALLEVEVEYRKPNDPNCCPSGKASLAIEIQQSEARVR